MAPVSPTRHNTPYTPARQLHARAGRAHEDPVAMTQPAIIGRLANIVTDIHHLNPDLTPEQLAKAARLRLRDEMMQLAERSAAARRERAGLDASGLADSGSDGIDADS